MDSIRHTFRWAMDRSTTYWIALIPLLNRFCHSGRVLPGKFQNQLRSVASCFLPDKAYGGVC